MLVVTSSVRPHSRPFASAAKSCHQSFWPGLDTVVQVLPPSFVRITEPLLKPPWPLNPSMNQTLSVMGRESRRFVPDSPEDNTSLSQLLGQQRRAAPRFGFVSSTLSRALLPVSVATAVGTGAGGTDAPYTSARRTLMTAIAMRLTLF